VLRVPKSETILPGRRKMHHDMDEEEDADEEEETT
jgi:hypothetical protein